MGDRLRVAYNASALPPRPAGAGIYTLELGRALERREDIQLLVAGRPERWGREVAWASPVSAAARTAWEQVDLPRAISRSGANVYHGAHFVTPVWTRAPRVATVHDLTFYRLPRRYGVARRWYYRAIAQTARLADRVIVPAAAIASDVVRFLGYPAERIRVVAEAPRAGWTRAGDEEIEAIRARLRIDGPYVLMVGTAEPGKRAIDGIRAVARLRETGVCASLVLAGNAGRLGDSLRREAVRNGLEKAVIFAGYVADDDLRALYSGAVALLFPSLYEGFGLPPLEAMACGAPVIASDRPAMNEVLRGAAHLVPAGDTRAMAAAVQTLMASEQAWREASEHGLEYARRFSWEAAAAETASVYREVAG